MTHIDDQRFQELIEAHAAALTLYARQWCRAPEDAVQEALVELLRQNTAPDDPAAWLYTAVRRRAMNLARAETRRVKHQRLAGQQRESWFLPAEDNLDDPIDFQPLLARLPRLEREIVVARVWGELSFAQIADLVEQSTSSVHRRYQRALSELARMITIAQEITSTVPSSPPRRGFPGRT